MTAKDVPPPMRELPRERLRQLEHHLLEEIARQPQPASPRGRLPRRIALVAAAVVALTVAAGVLGLRGGAGTASAAEVRAKLADGLTLRETISGEFSVRTRDPGPPPPGVRRCRNCTPRAPLPSKFVIGPDGSYSSLTLPLDAPNRRDVAYDATTGVETRFGGLGADPRGRPIYLRAVNLDPAFLPRRPEAHLGAWVQKALAGGDPRVEEVTFEGRAGWKLTAMFRPGERLYDAYGARLDVVVDQETGLVLQIVQYAYETDRWTSIASVRNLRIGEPASRGAFTVPRPRGAVVIAHDYAFRRVAVAAAEAAIGYRPLLPANTLGRPLSDFAVAETSSFPFPGVPVRRDAASARYGRGAAVVTVSTYRGPVGDLPQIAGGRTFDLTRGPLAGELAYVSTTPFGPALVAAFADGLLVRVTAPSVDEAITVAESLRAA